MTARGSSRSLGILVAVAATFGFACAPAVASCQPNHCHGIAVWNVEGKSGYGFKGADVVLDESKGEFTADEDENLLNNELWLTMPGTSKDKNKLWVEAGATIGCSELKPERCTNGAPTGNFYPTPPQYFWAENASCCFSGQLFPVGKGPGTEPYEVTISYYPPTGGWAIRIGNSNTGYVTGGANELESYGVKLETGVEVSTEKAHMEGWAGNLDWEDLSEKWHYSDWASGSSTAHILCQPPAKANWTTLYNNFQIGVNKAGEECTGETLDAAQTIGGEASSTTVTPAAQPLPKSSTGALTMEGVKAVAMEVAAIAGDASPTRIEAAQAPRASALAAVSRVSSVDDEPDLNEWLSGPTYAIVMRGHFTLGTNSFLEAAHTGSEATGEALSLVIDADTGVISAFDLSAESNAQPSLATLGTVDVL